MSLTSVIIPARNEVYLDKTIKDLLEKSVEDIEIIVVLDGYWVPAVIDDKRVHYLHFGKAKGMRNAINSAVALAKGKYILKSDAHCMYAKGFDKQLKTDHTRDTILVPSRYPLDPEKWEIETRTDNKYPVEYEYLDKDDLHGVEWREKRDERKDVKIDDIISAQGSCWFTTKRWFEKIGGLDESYGTFYLEFQELSFKTWTQGGKVQVDKNTYYCHWHKTGGRGYALSDDRNVAVKKMQEWKGKREWNQIIKKFLPMPGFEHYA